MPNGQAWVILFDSIHYVLAAERLLKEHGIPIDLIPVPRPLSADCGMAISVDGRHRDAIVEILADPRCRHRAIYRSTGGGYREMRFP